MSVADPLIAATVDFVKNSLAQAEGGHDWHHTERVWKMALTLAAEEPVEELVVSLGALLHDIADAKFHEGDETLGPRRARAFLAQHQVAPAVVDAVVHIIENISFKGGHSGHYVLTPELAVVQDADRLDAIGAIGIARVFNYGGFKNRPIHDPAWPFTAAPDVATYRNRPAPSIHHFYEKLLLLKDRMNTATGRRIAAGRHAFMENFLEQFYQEWEGKI